MSVRQRICKGKLGCKLARSCISKEGTLHLNKKYIATQISAKHTKILFKLLPSHLGEHINAMPNINHLTLLLHIS